MDSHKRYRVIVKPDSCWFPNRCLVCGEKTTNRTVIRFTKAVILGVIGGVDSYPLDVALCHTHEEDYRTRRRRYQTWLTLTALSGCTLAFGPILLVGDHGTLGSLAVAATILGYAALAVAIGIFLSRGRNFPVHFHPRQGRLFAGNKDYVFTFPNEQAAAAFAKANKTEVLPCP